MSRSANLRTSNSETTSRSWPGKIAHGTGTLARRLSLTVLAALTGLLLLIFVISFVISNTVLDRQRVQSWLGQPQTYELLQHQLANSTNVDLDDDARDSRTTEQGQQFAQLIDQHFGADKFASIVEQTIGAVFDWLDGAENIDFEVRLFDDKQQLQQFFVDAQSIRLRSLEPCSPSQLANYSAGDIFSVDCQPPSFTRQDLRRAFSRADDEQVDELFSVTAITDENLNLTTDNSELEQIKDAYQLVQVLPLITLTLVVVVLTLALMVMRDWRVWLRWSGLVLISSSAVMFVLGLLLRNVGFIRNQIEQSGALDGASLSRDAALAALQPVLIDVSQTLLLATGVLLLTGGAMFGSTVYLNHRRKQDRALPKSAN